MQPRGFRRSRRALRLWGGRFESGPAEALARLSVSVQFDWRLARYDLLASGAHARVLHRAGLLDDEELARLLAAIDELSRDCQTGAFRPTVADEDVHTALERGLLERVGSLGGRLRAGRSRNDQVATDLRLYLRDHAQAGRRAAGRAADRADGPGRAASRRADARSRADAHAARAAGAALASAARPRAGAGRDVARLRDWDKRAAICPLGSGALAGSSLPLDPEAVAAELGFDAPAANSMDAVADRDFAAEFCFAAALAGVHLSRLGEEVVLWTSHEFGWAEIDDAYATGSSIMPQKKNADVAELARGKAGRLIGGLTGLLTTLKGLPLTYNRDLQEDKEPVFDAVDTLLLVLPAMAGLVSSMKFRARPAGAEAAAGPRAGHRRGRAAGRRGVPFREAHEAVGHLVVWCQVNDCELGDVSDEDLAKVSPHLTPDVRSRAVGAGRDRGAGHRSAARRRRGLLTSSPRSQEVCRRGVWAAGMTGTARGGAAGVRSPASDLGLPTAPPIALAVLPREFFDRPVRRSRLRCSAACWCTRPTAGVVAAEMVEVEAYLGERRSGVACVPREDGAECGHVRRAGARVCLLHLRHAFLREPGLPAAWRGRPRCCCGPGGSSRARSWPRRGGGSPAG